MVHLSVWIFFDDGDNVFYPQSTREREREEPSMHAPAKLSFRHTDTQIIHLQAGIQTYLVQENFNPSRLFLASGRSFH